MGIEYTDGVSVESKIVSLLEGAASLDSQTQIGRDQYAEWAVRYHLSPERGQLLGALNFTGLNVVEVGAGMGAVSRKIAESASSLHLIEGTEGRLKGARARLRDLSNWSSEVGEFVQTTALRSFDVAAVIGVLEYSERFIPAPDAHLSFLQKISTYLHDSGAVVLAIENAAGLKYWSGAAEDHNGTMFDGIVGYSNGPGAKTFSKRSLGRLLEMAGFSHYRFFFPFPDYKVPSCILTERLMDVAPDTAASLACHRPFDNYCTPRVRYFPDSLSTLAAARNGLLSQLSNSFLVVAAKTSDSSVFQRLCPPESILGWHFGHVPTTFEERPNGQVVVCRGIESEPLIPGAPLRFELARVAYFGEWSAYLERFTHFLNWSLKTHRAKAGHLPSRCVDAVILNAIRSGEDYLVFDWAWDDGEEIPIDWFVFRNVFATIRDFECFGSNAPFSSLKELYELLCDRVGTASRFEASVELEARFQFRVSGVGSVEYHREELIKLMLHPFDALLPRDPAKEISARVRLKQLENENAKFRAFLERPTIRLAKKAVRALRRITGSHERTLTH